VGTFKMTVIQLARARNIAASPTIRPWQHVGWYILIPWLLVMLAMAAMPSRVFAADQIFVPMVLMNRGPVEGSSGTPVPCTLSGEETAVLAKMASSLEQRRPSLTCDPILAAVARGRAQDMAARDYFSHVTPEGKGPNTLVMEAGYVLPEWYNHDRDANNLESIAGGFHAPAGARQLLYRPGQGRDRLCDCARKPVRALLGRHHRAGSVRCAGSSLRRSREAPARETP
jgi:hypothetical protein